MPTPLSFMDNLTLLFSFEMPISIGSSLGEYFRAFSIKLLITTFQRVDSPLKLKSST